MNQQILDQITQIKRMPALNIQHIDFVHSLVYDGGNPELDLVIGSLCGRFGMDERTAAETVFMYGDVYEEIGAIRLYEFVQRLVYFPIGNRARGG